METEIQHRCSICSKTYKRKDLRDRHRRRCERSLLKPRKSKRKSCGACVKSKVSCDLAYPSCSRCLARNVSCQYANEVATPGSGNSLEGDPRVVDELLEWGDLTAPSVINDVQTPYPEQKDAVSVGNIGGAPSASSQAWQGALSQTEDLTNNQLDSLSADAYIDEQQTVSHNIEINLLASFGIPTAQGTDTPAKDARFESFMWHPPLSWDQMPDIEVPLEQVRNHEDQTNSALTLTSLSLDTSFQPSTSLSVPMFGNDEDWVKYVYGFPQMMLKAGTYPPFVHPTVYRCSEGEVLEALAIAFCCLGSYNAAMRSSQHFAYSLINRERDQLVKDFPRICSSQSEVWVLASVHAMCVYQIISFFGPSLEQARNAQLQQPWLLKMTRHLARLHKQTTSLAEQTWWEPWALGETIRRTILLVNTINCLSCRVGRQDAYLYEPLDRDLVSNLPLPAPTGLWKAKSAAEWETQKLMMAGPDLQGSQITLGETLASLLQASRANSLSWDGLDQYTRLVLDTLSFHTQGQMALV